MMYSLSNINGVPFDVLFFCAVAVEDLGYLLGYLYALLDYCFCVLFFTRDFFGVWGSLDHFVFYLGEILEGFLYGTFAKICCIFTHLFKRTSTFLLPLHLLLPLMKRLSPLSLCLSQMFMNLLTLFWIIKRRCSDPIGSVFIAQSWLASHFQSILSYVEDCD